MAAGIQHSIDIIFGADTTGLGGAINTVNTQLNGLESSMSGVTEPVANFTKSILATEAALLAAGAAMVGLSLNEAGRFTDAMVDLGALFNATGEQSSKLGDDLLEFGKTTAVAFEDIEAAAFIAISTGTDAAKVTDTLAEAQKLAVVGSTDLTTATAALSRTMNAYGLDASKAESVSEALFLSAQQGDTNFTALGSSIGKVAATAAASKVPFDDLLAAVSAITIAGVSTDETMTKLKALFLELGSPSDDLKKALGGLSLETDGLQAVMQKLQAVTGGSTTELDKLFSSSEALSGATILANDSAGKFASTLDLMANRAGIVQQNYDTMVEGFAASNQLLANNVRATLIETGKPLLDEYGSIVGAISKMFGDLSVDVKDGSLKKLTAGIEEFAGDAAKKVQEIAEALPEALERLDFDNLLAAFEDLGIELSDILDNLIGKDLDLSKPEDLAKALQRGVDLLQTMVVFTKGVVQEFQPIFAAIGEAITRVSAGDETIAKTAGNLAGTLTLIADFGLALGAAFKAINETGTSIASVFDVLEGVIKLFTNGVHSSFLLLERLMAETAVSFNEAMSVITFGETSKEFEQAAEKWKAIVSDIESDITQNGQDIKDAGDLIANAFKTSVEETSNSLGDLSKASDDSKDTIVENSAETGKALKDGFAGSEEAVRKLGDGLIYSADQFTDFAAKTDALTRAGIAFKSDWTDAGGVITLLADESENAANAMDASTQAAEANAATVQKLKHDTLELSEAQKISMQQTHELRLAMLEFASDERLKALEVGGNIRVAEIESDAEKVVAAYESIAESVGATSDAAADMFDTFVTGLASGNISSFDQLFIEDMLEKQFELQEKAIDSQVALNDAQIENLNARTKALQEGGGDINVTIDPSFEPETQALLYSFINKIRIQATAEGLGIMQ